MENEIKVSIIIPVYNCEDYLDECLKSVLRQTEKRIEIILINDGSTDNSKSIIEKYVKLDERIILVNQQNSGVSVARNNGINNAKGKYIMFIDSDDWIEECTIERMLHYASQYSVKYVRIACMKEMIDIGRKKISDIIFDDVTYIDREDFKYKIFDAFVETYSLNSPCLFIIERTYIIDNNISFNQNSFYAEDFSFNIEIFKKLESAVFLPYPYYHYVNNLQSITTKTNKHIAKLKIDNAIDNYSNLFDLAKCLGVYTLTNKHRIERRIDDETEHCLIDIYLTHKLIKRSERLELIAYKVNKLKETNFNNGYSISAFLVDIYYILFFRVKKIIKSLIRKPYSYLYSLLSKK